MSLFLSFSLCHPADGKFQVAVQLLGKPLHFQFLGLFRREREILFRAHFRSIDRRTGAAKPYPDFTVKTSGMVRLVDGEYLAYTTEETEKVEVYRLAEQLGGDIEAVIRQLAERRRKKE